ncbi:hypothetical protein FPV67DRAFT_1449182 [Lyophyllum atratum]|nr:hypothetical protein FPV67DRAFT_1452240 [Lyophyllum atratum]KAF8067538.1 hypothetical protein FPV67DRAFT_1449182 [Lyophyllum atratum]
MASDRRQSKPTAKHTPLKRPTVSRQPPRCNKCPDRPLRDECIHTVKGRTFLKSREQEGSYANNNSSQEPQIGSESAQPNADLDPFALPSLQNNTVSQQVQYTLSTPLGGSGILPNLTTPTPSQPQLIAQSQFASSTSLYRFTLGPSESDIGSEPMSQSTFTPGPSEPDAGSQSVLSTPAACQDKEALLASGSSKRLRISQKSAAHGFVAGVKRGNQEYLIPRAKPLRPKLTKVSEVSARFNREIQGLVSRCERLSEECDLWMVLAVQQPTGASTATHYTSPRLRRDAKADTAKILNQFQVLTSGLLAAKRNEALEIAKELQIAIAEKESLQEETQKVMADKDAEIIAHASVIADLQAKIKQLEGAGDETD